MLFDLRINPAREGAIFAKNGTKDHQEETPVWCSLSKTAGGHLAIGNYIRYKVEAILDPKNSKKLAYQYRKKTTFFLQKILYYLPILERKRGVPRAKFDILKLSISADPDSGPNSARIRPDSRPIPARLKRRKSPPLGPHFPRS